MVKRPTQSKLSGTFPSSYFTSARHSLDKENTMPCVHHDLSHHGLIHWLYRERSFHLRESMTAIQNPRSSAQTRLRNHCTNGLQNGPCSSLDQRNIAKQKTRMAEMTMPSMVLLNMKINRFIRPPCRKAHLNLMLEQHLLELRLN